MVGGRRKLASAAILILVLAALLPAFSLSVAAHEPKKDSGHNDGRDEGRVNFEKVNGLVYLHSSGQGNASHESLDLVLDTNGGLSLRLTMRHSDDHVTTKMTITVEFLCLVGLKEGETAGQVHCGGNASERSTLKFSKMGFKEPTYSNYTEKDETVHRLEASSKDYTFLLKVDMTGDFSKGNGTSMPDNIGIHIKVHNFDYEKEDQELGLDMKVTSNLIITVRRDLVEHDGSATDIIEEQRPSEPKEEELGGSLLALNDQATVDGVSKDVGVVATETDGGMLVSVAYPRGETIQQDMEMTIHPKAVTLNGNAPLYIAGIGVVVAVFVFTDKRILAKLARK